MSEICRLCGQRVEVHSTTDRDGSTQSYVGIDARELEVERKRAEEAERRVEWLGRNGITRDSDGDWINWGDVEDRWYRQWDDQRRRAEAAESALAAATKRAEEAEWITCGMTYQDRAVEERVNALRQIEGHSVGIGCGNRLKIMYAYRCVECGRWFDRECILHHFAANGDLAAKARAEAEARVEAAEQQLAAERKQREAHERAVSALSPVAAAAGDSLERITAMRQQIQEWVDYGVSRADMEAYLKSEGQ